MKILGIDTATWTAGVAVIHEQATLAEHREVRAASPKGERSGRSADLLVTIDDVCRRAGVAPSALDAIAIGAGPGSFTGLRIGMATAKGIAFAARRPLWAVSSLAALARDAELHLAGERDRVIVAVLDARRAEVFAGCYLDGVLLAPERVLAPAELAAWVQELARARPTSFAGDALGAFPDVLAPLAASWLPIATPSGVAVAQLTLAGARVDVLTDGTPTYIRPSEAEVMYPDGVPGALPGSRPRRP
ncbi:MAG: tRNA (adenosine(37)-N6)-threonylcarbamoyltransferase complex dimerization subunit type 1 TsaB [Deltaproteobacteria bacterium]|nr:tRNA (adenosine(37)-N6)-threonylcarbamoyltransferase complex dimerization subunit type 1 TsaB [Deltaproteobacteria bacterium]MDQ3298982.1 tRNA (adenosine(37)-N6)-threonylcarbamoyltransferase complex dimerization subunit type 1 TsaB [Myxococcota bacterium]